MAKSIRANRIAKLAPIDGEVGKHEKRMVSNLLFASFLIIFFLSLFIAFPYSPLLRGFSVGVLTDPTQIQV